MAERVDAEFSQYGEVAVPNQSGHIYLVTNRHGQHRLITVSRPMITGEMYGVDRDAAGGARLDAHPDCRADRATCRSRMCPTRPTAGSRRATRAARFTASICSGSRAISSQCSCREPVGFHAATILAQA